MQSDRCRSRYSPFVVLVLLCCCIHQVACHHHCSFAVFIFPPHIHNPVLSSVKERAEEKESKKREEKLKGVVQRIMLMQVSDLLSLGCGVLYSNIYKFYECFTSLGYSTVASLEQPPIAPQKSETGPLILYPFDRLITAAVLPL